jgi:hypothetical protein
MAEGKTIAINDGLIKLIKKEGISKVTQAGVIGRDTPKNGQQVTIHYKGKLEDGTDCHSYLHACHAYPQECLTSGSQAPSLKLREGANLFNLRLDRPASSLVGTLCC